VSKLPSPIRKLYGLIDTLSIALLLALFFKRDKKVSKNCLRNILRLALGDVKAHPSAIDKRILDFLIEGIVKVEDGSYMITERGQEIIKVFMEIDEIKHMADRIMRSMGSMFAREEIAI